MERKIFWRLVLIVLLLWVLSFIMSLMLPGVSQEYISAGNVAKIKIDGMIVTQASDSVFGSVMSSSNEINRQIENAADNPGIKAIIFEINSPGGSPLGSAEVARVIEKVNITTVAVIKEIGTSGAYWIASATDYVYADELSITGSIGVISSYLEFSRLFDKYGITYQRLVSGEFKDMGSPYKSMTDAERAKFQGKIDKIHEYFISNVAENRGMDIERVREVATGEFYLGEEAKDLGLIDDIGDEEKAIDYLKGKLNLTDVQIAEYKKPKTLLDILAGVLNENSFYLGKGMSSFLSADMAIRT